MRCRPLAHRCIAGARKPALSLCLSLRLASHASVFHRRYRPRCHLRSRIMILFRLMNCCCMPSEFRLASHQGSILRLSKRRPVSGSQGDVCTLNMPTDSVEFLLRGNLGGVRSAQECLKRARLGPAGCWSWCARCRWSRRCSRRGQHPFFLTAYRLGPSELLLTAFDGNTRSMLTLKNNNNTVPLARVE